MLKSGIILSQIFNFPLEGHYFFMKNKIFIFVILIFIASPIWAKDYFIVESYKLLFPIDNRSYNGWGIVTGIITTTSSWDEDFINISANVGGYYYRSQAQSINETKLLLSPLAKKKFSIYVYITQNSYSINLTFSSKKETKNININIREDYSYHKISIGYVFSNNTAKYDYLRDIKDYTPWKSWTNNSNGIQSSAEKLTNIIVTQLSSEELPDNWFGYEILDVLILQDYVELTKEQKQAISEWVVSGGILILAPQNQNWLRNNPWVENLLGFSINERNHKLDMTPSSIAKIQEKNLGVYQKNKIFTLAMPKGASYEPGISNIIWRIGNGFGSIIYCGIDLSYGQYSIKTWEKIILPNLLISLDYNHTRQCEISQKNMESYYDFSLRNLMNFSRNKQANFNIIFLLLIFYLFCVGPVNFIYLRRKDKTIHLIWTIPCISLLFLGIIFSYGYWLKGSKTLGKSVQFIQTFPDADLTLRTEYISILSGANNLFNFELKNTNGYIVSLATSRYNENKMVRYNQEKNISIPSYSLNIWEMGYFKANYITPKIDILVEKNGDSIHIKNQSNLVLGQAIIITPKESYFLEATRIDGISNNTYRLQPEIIANDLYSIQEELIKKWKVEQEKQDSLKIILNKVDFNFYAEKNTLPNKSIPTITLLVPIIDDPLNKISSCVETSSSIIWDKFSVLCIKINE